MITWSLWLVFVWWVIILAISAIPNDEYQRNNWPLLGKLAVIVPLPFILLDYLLG